MDDLLAYTKIQTDLQMFRQKFGKDGQTNAKKQQQDIGKLRGPLGSMKEISREGQRTFLIYRKRNLPTNLNAFESRLSVSHKCCSTRNAISTQRYSCIKQM